MKFLPLTLSLVLVLPFLGVPQDRSFNGSPRRIDDDGLRLEHGYVWVSFEQAGKTWMVGGLKEDARTVKTYDGRFGLKYAVKLYGDSAGPLCFLNGCTTNITVGTNYRGTVTFESKPILKKSGNTWIVVLEKALP